MKLPLAVICVSVIAWLVINAVGSYRATIGSFADKLAAAWRGSLTVFVLFWGALVTVSVSVLDTLSQMTGDPQFTQFADSLKAAVPHSVLPYVPSVIMAIGIAARLTHNPPRDK